MDHPNPVSNISICARCQKPATLSCVGCQDAPPVSSQVNSIFYCSVACSEADKDEHKAVCEHLQVRQLFYRAGDILQEVFYIYKEKIFLNNIVSVEVMQNGDIGLKMDNMDNKTQMAKMPTFVELVQKFPGKKCGSRGARKAVLTYGAGSDAVAWMHDLVKYSLDGIAVKIEEISLEPKNHKRQVIDLDPRAEQQAGGFKHYHDILKVELKNGEVYALDFAGAQFGYYDPVTPWEEYLVTRIEKITERDDWEKYRHFGGLKKMHIKESNDMSSLDMFQFSQFAGLNFCASQILEETLLGFLQEQGLTNIREVLKMPRDGYQSTKKEFLSTVGSGMNAFVSCARKKLSFLRVLRDRRGWAKK